MSLGLRHSRWLLLIVVIAISSIASLIAISLLTKPDFSLVASPNPLLVRAGLYPSEVNSGTQFTTVTASSLRSFSGTVTLRTLAPSGVSAHLDGPNLTPQDKILLGASGNLSLWIGAASTGNYTVRIVATSGTLSHTVDLRVVVENLTITLNPTSVNLTHGTSTSVQVTLSSINGLSGNLSMGSQTYYYDSYGDARCCTSDTTSSFNPSSLTIPSGATVTTIMTVTATSGAAIGPRLVQISAMRGSIDWQFTASLSVTVT